MDTDSRKYYTRLKKRDFTSVLRERNFNQVLPGRLFTQGAAREYGIPGLFSVLLVLESVGFTTASLDWTYTPTIVPVASYNLYRGLGATPTSWTLVTNTALQSYSDSGLAPGTTYSWYVQAVFPSGAVSRRSNVVTGTTLTLSNVYTLRGALDIYDVSTPTAPVLAATVADGLGGGNPYDQYADQDYLWINDGESLFTFQFSGNPLNPTLVHTMVGNYGPPWIPPFFGCVYFIIRRNLSDRNNLLILYNPHNQYNGSLESYDITDPANPVLINSQEVDSGYNSPRGFAYDAMNHRIFNHYTDRFSDSWVSYIPVASDGTLGASVRISGNLDILGRDWALGWMYGGDYWTYESMTNAIVAVMSNGLYRVGKGGALPGVGITKWAGVQPRVKGKYLFLGADHSDASFQAVLIWDMDAWVQVAQLGGVSQVCSSLIVSGNLLIFATQNDSKLYVYDITATLASGGAPVQLGVLQELNRDNGFAAFPTDGWEGNNGGCAT